ncbi:hypothetical protein LINGRAHAP2_LOCUS30133, partial [Linum grandiflorum]
MRCLEPQGCITEQVINVVALKQSLIQHSQLQPNRSY